MMLRQDVVKEVDYLASTRTQRTQRTGFLTCLVNRNPWVGNKTCELFKLFRWDMNCGTCLAKIASHNDDNWFQRTTSKNRTVLENHIFIDFLVTHSEMVGNPLWIRPGRMQKPPKWPQSTLEICRPLSRQNIVSHCKPFF